MESIGKIKSNKFYIGDMIVKLPEKSNWYGYCNMHDYTPKTPYFVELNIAIANGPEAIDKLIKGILDTSIDYIQFTELVLIVNLLSWDMYRLHEETNDPKYQEIGECLIDEYYKLRDEFYERYQDETARAYFWEMTD